MDAAIPWEEVQSLARKDHDTAALGVPKMAGAVKSTA